MSTISERKKDGKVVAFKFLACLGRDADGKRICKGTTWRPPEGLSYVKARKLAEAEAFKWEQELRGETACGEYSAKPPAPCEAPVTPEIVPEEETFRYFVEQIWMLLKVVAGGLRPSTIAMYQFMLRVALPKLGDKRLTEVSAVDIMRYLQYLRDEYRAPDGRTLSEKSIKHHYDILRIIFNYAEKQEFMPCSSPTISTERLPMSLSAALVLNIFHFQIQKPGQFAGQRITALLVAVLHERPRGRPCPGRCRAAPPDRPAYCRTYGNGSQ